MNGFTPGAGELEANRRDAEGAVMEIGGRYGHVITSSPRIPGQREGGFDAERVSVAPTTVAAEPE